MPSSFPKLALLGKAARSVSSWVASSDHTDHGASSARHATTARRWPRNERRDAQPRHKTGACNIIEFMNKNG